MPSPAPLLLLCGIKTHLLLGAVQGQTSLYPRAPSGRPSPAPASPGTGWGQGRGPWAGTAPGQTPRAPRPLCGRSHPFLLLGERAGTASEHRHTPASARPPRHPPHRRDGADASRLQRVFPPPRRPWAGATVPQPGVAPATSRQLPGEGVTAPDAGSRAGDPSHTLAEGHRAPAHPATGGSRRQRCFMNSLVPQNRRLIPSVSLFVLLGSSGLLSFTASARNIPDVFQNTASAALGSESWGYGNLHPPPSPPKSAALTAAAV